MENPPKIYEGDDKFKELKAMFTSKIIKISDKDITKAMNIGTDMQAEFSKKYPKLNLREYKLFNMIVASTIFDDGSTPFYDLPNGELEELIRNL
jgi:hypothetical protein